MRAYKDDPEDLDTVWRIPVGGKDTINVVPVTTTGTGTTTTTTTTTTNNSNLLPSAGAKQNKGTKPTSRPALTKAGAVREAQTAQPAAASGWVGIVVVAGLVGLFIKG